MSKPLELTVYPKTCTCTVDDEGCTLVPMDCLMHGVRVTSWGGQKKKRLTEAELAAQMYATEIEWKDLVHDGYDPASPFAEATTLHRFATSPHYFEERSA